MRIGYFGTALFAVPALEAVAASVVLVVTQPDRPSGRGMELRPSPVKAAAQKLGLRVESPAKCRDATFVASVGELELDALLVAAYGQILPETLLQSAARGALNLHGSVLPKYRGAAPIQRALLDGQKETGVTLMQMDKGMDTGDVIAVERVTVGSEETAGELTDKLAAVAARMAAVWMPRVVKGDYARTPQDDAMATYAPKVDKSEARLDFDRDSKQEFDRYRAFTPQPGAFLETKAGRIKIHRAAHRPAADPGPGVLSLRDGEAIVGFQRGGIALLDVQPEGKKRASGRDFVNGARLSDGECLRVTYG